MVGKAIKIIIFLSILFSFYVVGTLIFTKGFLLSRIVVNRNSTCHVNFAEYANEAVHGKPGCWLHRRFDRAIIIIIDALRFDFMTPIRDSSTKAPYLNKLATIHNLIDSKPQNARLFKFLADPPTTTLQRLKGLTTGSLPTFVDAGSNFASTEITEDNFIDQLIKKGKKLTFMGDDTWISLFPGRFNKQYPFPSFNVKDLNTVDDGILANLFGEIRSRDWDVIISHFLGVDHCGHTYGPNSPAMTSKLTQMDQMIRNVTSLLSDDTVLFVMGDHGMTGTGDHGGDSQDELSAGLFVYSPTQITASKAQKDVYRSVSQTDFVPTLSLLLGIPIPFSNLGTAIIDLLNYCAWSKDSHIKEVYHTIEAVRLNAVQMSRYLESYMEISSDLSPTLYHRLQENLGEAESHLQHLVTELFIHGHADDAHGKLHQLLDRYLQFTEEAREMCKDVWAKFDLVSISLGILVLMVSLGVNFFLLKSSDDIHYEGKTSVTAMVCIGIAAVFVVYSGVQTFYMEGKLLSVMAFVLGLVDVIAVLIIIKKMNNKAKTSTSERNKDESKPKQTYSCVPFLKLYCGVAIVGSFLSFFSNSYVVYEDRIATYFAQTLIWLFFTCCVQHILVQNYSKERKSKLSSSNRDIMEYLTQPVMIVFYLTVFCSTSLRISVNFRACREEQINCTLSSFLQPLSSLGKTVEGRRNIRYFTSAACLVALVYMFRRWLKHYGNLNGSSLPVFCARYLLPVAVICSIFHWAIEGLSENTLSSMAVWQQTLFAQVVYTVVILSLFAIIVSPLLIFKLPQHGNNLSLSSEANTNPDFLIHKVHNYVKWNWDTISGSSQLTQPRDKPPMVYGLGTVYTSAIIYVGCILCILVALLLGDGLSPTLLLLGLTTFTFLELYTTSVRLTDKGKDLVWPGVLTMCLLSTHFFYATGHHATIPSIRFEAAYVGFHGNWNVQIIPAFLIFLNTYSAEVILTWLLPLLVIWPSLKGVVSQLVLKAKDDEFMRKGDFVFFESQELFLAKLTTVVSCAYLCQGIRLFGAMLAAFIHRRHLFVWKIFAPRFVFQALSSFSVFGVSILSLMFVLRIHWALEKWVQKLSAKSE